MNPILGHQRLQERNVDEVYQDHDAPQQLHDRHELRVRVDVAVEPRFRHGLLFARHHSDQRVPVQPRQSSLLSGKVHRFYELPDLVPSRLSLHLLDNLSERPFWLCLCRRFLHWLHRDRDSRSEV